MPDRTKLTKAEEKLYQQWKVKLPKALQYEEDYDLRGLWKSNPKIQPTPNLHFPDTYKLPNHPTFSNESIYFSEKNKNQAGFWQETDTSFNYIPYNPLIKDTVIERKMPDGGEIKKRKFSKIPSTVAPSEEPIRNSLSDITLYNTETLQKYNPDNAVRNWYLSYISSPKYEERLRKMGYTNTSDVIRDRKARIQATKIAPQTDTKLGSAYVSSDNTVFMDNNQVSELGTIRNDILSHEFGHVINSSINARLDPNYKVIETPSNTSLSKEEEKYIGIRNKKVGPGMISVAEDNATKYNKTISNILSEVNHDYSPYESKSDIDSFRYMLKQEGIYDAGKEDFTPELLEKARKNKAIKGSFNPTRLFEHFSDKDLIDIMNNISGNPSVKQTLAKTGGTINSKMRNSYTLANGGQLPGFLGDLQAAGQNFGITDTDIGLNALNYFGNLFAEKIADRDNRAYQDYWRRQYQIPEMAVNPFAFGDPNQMAKGGIHIKPENRGKFTRWAKSRGMGVQEAARKVLAAKEGTYSPAVRRMANFARNFGGNKNYGGEYLMGGPIPFGYKLMKDGLTLKRIYKAGGEINKTASPVDDEFANIEAEKGEYIFGTGFSQNPFVESSNIGVGLYKIEGNKHYNGGTKLRANPGDFIFSDDKDLSFSEEAVEDLLGKKIPKKLNRTPAKLAGTFSKLNDFINTAQDSKAMPLDRKTSILNVENMIDKLADIAIGQEAIKGFPNGVPAFAQASIEKRSMPTIPVADEASSAAIPMAKKGGTFKPKYQEAGPVLPFITSLLFAEGDPWKGDKTKDKKGVFQNPRDNRFPGNYPEFENRIQQAGFSGNINDNREIQRFLYNNLMQSPEGRSELAGMWNQYGITNYGQQLAGMNLPANFNLPSLEDPNSDESVRLQNWGNFYDDGMIGVRTRMLADNLTPSIDTPVTGYPNLTPVPGVRRDLPPTVGLDNPVPNIPVPGAPTPPPVTRRYDTPVNMNIAEAYGLLAANRRFAPRYPTAQRFYEGENIDATLNAGFQPISVQPVLNNIQRQMNVFNENNSGYGPISYARNSYAFTQGLNAQNSAIAQNQLQNTQRRDQLTQSLAQNQALKGQYRLQLQDKYLRELETLNNNREQAAKNRMAQTSNLLNSFVNRAYTQRYSNAMMDYFELDPNGNLRPRAGINMRDAIMEQSSGTQMNTQLRYAEQLFKLMQQYGIKGSGFVDNVLKPNG